MYNLLVGAKVGSLIAVAVPQDRLRRRAPQRNRQQLLIAKIVGVKDAPKPP